MNRPNPAQIQRLMKTLEHKSMQYRNFSPNRTAFGYDADSFNFDNAAMQQLLSYMGKSALGYDSDALNYGGSAFPANWTKQQEASGNLTTYKLRVIYTPGPNPPKPVRVTFFRSAFNTGTFDPITGDLVFTNANGDTASIVGMTTSTKTLYNLTETEPFVLSFIRMTPKSQSQLDNPVKILRNTQWDSGQFNNINPDIYISPDQYQLLKADVPFNLDIDKKQGFEWDIDVDQTGTGVGLVLFIGKTLESTKALQNKPIVRELGPQVNTFYQPGLPAGQIRNAIAMQELQHIMRNPSARAYLGGM